MQANVNRVTEEYISALKTGQQLFFINVIFGSLAYFSRLQCKDLYDTDTIVKHFEKKTTITTTSYYTK